MIFLSLRFYTVAAVLLFFCFYSSCNLTARTPNVVIIFADDMGYGDMSNNGHPSIRTPYLDRIAYEGQKWSNFYVAAPVCTPSRAALLTGRYPIRNGMCSSVSQVLFPESTGGLPESEITIADLLSGEGYATAMVGKWHLGHLPEFLPTKHGFDNWFGIPYSNDMDLDRKTVTALNGGELGLWHTGKHWDDPKSEYWRVPLMHGDQIIKRSPDQSLLTKMYTEHSVEFIKDNADKPFFLYLAHSMPHVPLFRSEKFIGRSTAGIYGDVIEEIDWSVGQIIKTLESLEISEHTLVVFTSDNGGSSEVVNLGDGTGEIGTMTNWKSLGKNWANVSNTPYREYKNWSHEGGIKTPLIAYWPKGIKNKNNIAHTPVHFIDVLPTFQELLDVEYPEKFNGEKIISSPGRSFLPEIKGEKYRNRSTPIFWQWSKGKAIRQEDWKLVSYNNEWELYNLKDDPVEEKNLIEDNPEKAEFLKKQYTEWAKQFDLE